MSPLQGSAFVIHYPRGETRGYRDIISTRFTCCWWSDISTKILICIFM